MTELKVKKLHPDAIIPKYAHQHDAGFDISCLYDLMIPPDGTVVMASTGLQFDIPPGYELQIRPRSGLSSRGLTIPNSPGTIDSGFESELRILLQYLRDVRSSYMIEAGSRIAQAVLAPVSRAHIIEVDEIESSSGRGTGGFGSTGK